MNHDSSPALVRLQRALAESAVAISALSASMEVLAGLCNAGALDPRALKRARGYERYRRRYLRVKLAQMVKSRRVQPAT